MPDATDIERWTDTIRRRYENYLKTSFYFKDADLRRSFQSALQEEGSLLKGPFPEPARGFKEGRNARALAQECFPHTMTELLPALLDRPLYVHQERAVRATHMDRQNIVVATGTASGKTESFLYPILFELYRQHLADELQEPGVRALILYPMNALANDQRARLGNICKALEEAGSAFRPTFGQYIGQTPEDEKDDRRNAAAWMERRLPDELIFRKEMRNTSPHILLTNYSMLEYLLIRPDDSPLFDDGRGKHWQFIVLDEAHQYRGAKGMEMGMLVRRLKQRLRDGGRKDAFRCIATSATISSGEDEEDKQAVAQFAEQLFGEPFSASGIIFGESEPTSADEPPRRYHAFLRALEGAFLVHHDGADAVVLNRKGVTDDDSVSAPLEIALCRECGQHYYVGQERNGTLQEAVRDPSQSDFGVDYYLPSEDGSHLLCKRCGALSTSEPTCDCHVPVRVEQCEPHKEHADQLKQCATCGYQRGGIGDPVQEIIHGSDAPNAVIATALHELLPEDRRKVLAFADSRQEAAFFAWYAEDSYTRLRDRNLMLRAMQAGPIDPEGLSIEDLRNRLSKQWEAADLFADSDTKETRDKKVLTSILTEALTDERRVSLSGVGLVRWFVEIPNDLALPNAMFQPPWNLPDDEARRLLGYLLDELRVRRAVNLPEGPEVPVWSDVSTWNQQAYGSGAPGNRRNVVEWGGSRSTIVGHFLRRLLADSNLSGDRRRSASIELMQDVWRTLREHDGSNIRTDPILSRAKVNGTFRLNPRWLRITRTGPNEVWECKTCASLTSHNVRNVCPRNNCPGNLQPADQSRLQEDHYRILYESENLPPTLSAEEHTAQIGSDEARERQDRFKDGKTHLLSSSTTFEVGVDLGDLEVVFLRNVPPEPFNYTQRVGRAGRRETPGLAVTYCRRNPHDLYHFEKPEERIIDGTVRPPRLQMTNTKIVIRHMVATALSAFFEKNRTRFENVEAFVGDWSNPCAVSDLKRFCANATELKDALRQIVPTDMHEDLGLAGNAWIDNVAGPKSRFVSVEAEACADYLAMRQAKNILIDEQPSKWTSHVGRLERRMKTIASEQTLTFLSRKAVIPKYGFPVDVVELDTHPKGGRERGVSLQRDLSQAIAEYAPGGKVVANKLEWQSCGIKTIPGKTWPVRHYRYDDARNFRQWNEGDPGTPSGMAKYLSPVFGFVTPIFERPKEPRGRVRRLYTTRPFFQGFGSDGQPASKTIFGVHVTKAMPGTLVVLCEGRNREGFHICRSCGAHMTEPRSEHRTPTASACRDTLERFSLGHELVTDVVRLQFPKPTEEWEAYSVASAVLLGAAEALDVPDTDLNVTITGGTDPDASAIVLYDNVPGGAGLVAQLEHENVFHEMLRNAQARVRGNCGCDSSCYGCLRSYRNQFAHPYLDRKRAMEILSLEESQ